MDYYLIIKESFKTSSSVFVTFQFKLLSFTTLLCEFICAVNIVAGNIHEGFNHSYHFLMYRLLAVRSEPATLLLLNGLKILYNLGLVHLAMHQYILFTRFIKPFLDDETGLPVILSLLVPEGVCNSVCLSPLTIVISLMQS